MLLMQKTSEDRVPVWVQGSGAGHSPGSGDEEAPPTDDVATKLACR
jgi:hypothetical protein